MKSASFFIIASSCILLLCCKSRLYRVPSTSMENTFKMGETFLITPANKFENNEVVVFDLITKGIPAIEDTAGKKPYLESRLCRLVAQSGDILQIRNGDLYVNNKEVPLPPLAKIDYEILGKQGTPDFDEEDFEATNIYQSKDTFIYRMNITAPKAEEYRKRNPAIVIGIRRQVIPYHPFDSAIARSSVNVNWSPDNYGPLKIPLPGETININAGNYNLYKNIPDVLPGSYTIKEKLYFVLGDNRHYAQDSRYIGFITHSAMKGVVKNK